MKKAIRIAGGVAAVIGAFVAVCTVDGCEHEVAARLTGVAMFVVGVIVNAMASEEAAQ